MRHNQVIRLLINILGTDKVVNDEEEIKKYSKNALDLSRVIPYNFKPQIPIAVVRPSLDDDIVALVKFANRGRIPLVPYGGGTGLLEGTTTVKRGIVVDMKNMNAVSINKDDLTVDVGVGIVVKQLVSKVQQYGLLFVHDPWSASYCTVGGAIATNGVGYLTSKYGSMREQVLGLRAVAGDSTLIDIKSAKKTSTGLDLKNLFIGSEGILGILTSATLKLYPSPSLQKIYAFQFKHLESGYNCISNLS